MTEPRYAISGVGRFWPEALLVLLGSGLAVWLGAYLGYWADLPAILWLTSDSHSYREVADWLSGQSDFSACAWSAAIRPLGYPLFLAVCRTGGDFGLVGAQLVLWLAGQVLLLRLVRERLGDTPVTAALALLSVICVSPLAMAFTGLSETLALFLQMAALYAAHRFERHGRAETLVLTGLLLALGAAVRPAGWIPWAAFTLAGAVYFVNRKSARWALALVLAGAPVFAQLAIMRAEFGITKLSIIDDLAFDRYLLARADALIQRENPGLCRQKRESLYLEPLRQAGRPEGVAKYSKYVDTELKDYLHHSSGWLLRAYAESLRENFCSAGSLFHLPRPQPAMIDISRWQNQAFSYAGLIGGLATWLGLCVITWLRGDIWPTRHWLKLFLAGLAAYYLLISGISFWQGDRLSLPAYQPALLLLGLWLEELRPPSRASGRPSA